MSIRKQVAVAFLLIASASAESAVTTTVVDVPTRGVTQRFLYLRPDVPIANVVIWPGGDGILGIASDGRMATQLATCNPAVRNRQALADHGYAVAVVDAPSDGLVWRYEDMVEVIRHMQQRDDVPTWVLGGSVATSSTVELAARLPLNNPLGAIFYSPESFSVADAALIRRPSLVVYHPLDSRQMGNALHGALTSASARQEIILTGGNNTGCAGYHTLNGLNGPFVDAVKAFIDQYNPTLVSPPGVATLAVEFYNASLDHYFLTHIANEIALLDAGVTLKGWVRTGQSFNVYPAALAGSSPVCRFYIPPDKGDSHFYGRGVSECAGTGAANPTFVNEDPQFFHVVLPVAGVCPAGTRNVYRVFSNRPDANHRYTVDRAIRDLMVTRNWLAEGDGPDLVVMCSPV